MCTTQGGGNFVKASSLDSDISLSQVHNRIFALPSGGSEINWKSKIALVNTKVKRKLKEKHTAQDI